MDARRLFAGQLLCLATLVFAASTGYAASARTQNFIVKAGTQELANEIATAAENFRRDLAIEWLGKELPNWEQPCPITAQVDPRHGAGGATSFIFGGGRPHSWTMSIQGSRERVLDSVLPHEVTHTIFATHFCRPLPRWADEGACTTVEHASERGKQEKLLYQFLTSNRGIPFNRMFAMKEYPQDILPLYSQGYSLARYLIALGGTGGKRKFVDYVGAGMNTNNWTAVTKQHYGFHSLSDLQLSWLEWVRKGTPKINDANDVLYVSTDPSRSGRTLAEVNGQAAPSVLVDNDNSPEVASEPARGRTVVGNVPEPEHPLARTQTRGNASRKGPPANRLADSKQESGDGWYARNRDRASSRKAPSEERLAAQPAATGASPSESEEFASRSRPQPPDQVRQRIMEWSKNDDTLVPTQ